MSCTQHEPGRQSLATLPSRPVLNSIPAITGSPENVYALIIETLAEGIWAVDESWKTLFVNRHLAEMLGYRPQEMIGRHIFDFMDGDQRSFAAENMERRQRGIKETHDFRFHCREGGDVWTKVSTTPLTNEKGKFCGALALVTNVSDLKRLEDDQTKWKNRLESAIVASGQILYDLDTTTNEIIYGGDCKGMLGYSTEELAGGLSRWLELVHPEDRGSFENLTEHKTPVKDVVPIEYKIRRKDGSYILVRSSGRFCSDEGGNKLRMIGLIENINERRMLEDELRQARKIDAIGQLAGGIAHDFNNLLVAILGYGELLRRRLGSDNPLQEFASEITQAALNARELTGRLLAFSQRQVLQPRILNLNSLVNRMSRFLRRTIGEEILFDIRLEPNLWLVRADPAQIEAILLNLSVNARDAMPQGGNLTFETKNVLLSEPLALRHPEVAPGACVRASVTDTGCGIDQKNLSHIFEPFFTTKEPGKGVGLGLAMVYGTVKQSGGFIEVISELGVGTRFEVYLPAVRGEAVELGHKDVHNGSLTGLETILLVEDEETVGRLTEEILVDSGYKVVVVNTASKALDWARSYQGPIHLLLTDVVMPQMRGPELARELLKLRPTLKVLQMSGYAAGEFRASADHTNESNFLKKPFLPAELLGKIRGILGG